MRPSCRGSTISTARWTQGLLTLLGVLGGATALGSFCGGSGATRRAGALVRLARLLRLLLASLAVLLLAVIWAYRPGHWAPQPCQQVWARPLATGERAVCFVNWAREPAKVTCDAQCMAKVWGLGPLPAGVGGGAGTQFTIRELVEQRASWAGEFTTFAIKVGGDGGSVLYRFRPKPICDRTSCPLRRT